MAYKTPITRMYQFSMPTSASSTDGLLSKSNNTNGNPGALASTSSGNPGINNGNVDPYIATEACIIKRAVLKIAHAAVSQGTTGASMTARFTVYRVDYSSRTSVGTFDVPITSAGIFNDLSGNNFQSSTLNNINIPLASGDTFGINFTTRSANNNEIVSLGGIWLAVETENF